MVFRSNLFIVNYPLTLRVILEEKNIYVKTFPLGPIRMPTKLALYYFLLIEKGLSKYMLIIVIMK